MRRINLLLLLGACLLAATVVQLSGPAVFGQDAPGPTPKMIAIEVLMIETRGAPGDARLVDLSGPSEQVAARVRELEQAGKLDVVDRVRLNTLELQKALMQTGRTVAVPVSRSAGFGRGGPTQTSYQSQNVGTMLSVTARVDGEAVVVEISLEKSQLQPAARQEPDDEGAGFTPPMTATASLRTTVSIPDSTFVLVGGQLTKWDQSAEQLIVIASARIIEASGSPREDSKSKAGTAAR